MGLLQPGLLHVASADGFVSHVGLPVFRVEALGPSPDKRLAACAQHDAGIVAASPSDRCDLAKPVGGGVVWMAPVAGGIGGLGGGAQSEEHTSELQSLRHLVCRL